MRKKTLIFLTILFVITLSFLNFYTLKYVGNNICNAFSYEKAVAWDYTQQIRYGESNYIRCCNPNEVCGIIYFQKGVE